MILPLHRETQRGKKGSSRRLFALVFASGITGSTALLASKPCSTNLWSGLSRELVLTQAQSSLDLRPAELAKIVKFWEAKYRLCVASWAPHYNEVTNLIRKHGCKYVCEVGIAFGTQSEHILANTEVELLCSIDPYVLYPNDLFSRGAKSQRWMDVLAHITKARLSRYGARSHFIRKKSKDAILLIANSSLDLVYIDGEHSYQAVKHDLRAWYKKVRSGGLIVGDDYKHKSFPGLKKAVDEFVRTNRLHLTLLRGNKFVITKR